MEKFTIEEFNDVILFIWNRGFEEFEKMYKAVGLTGEAYAKEKWDHARLDFATWWLNLDKFIQVQILQYVKDFYHHE